MPDSALLRPGLLEGQVVGAFAAGALGSAAAAVCEELGATVENIPAAEAIADVAERRGRLDTVVIDADGMFAAAPQAGLAPLRAAADGSWAVARAAGTAAMIEAADGGKLVVLAPRPQAGPHAAATRAALENLARTLSIEWSRHHIRITTIHPGEHTAAAELGELVAFLASPAGDYFSGCLFSMGEVPATG